MADSQYLEEVKKKAKRLLDQKLRTRVPDGQAWTTQRILTAKSAIIACSVCRNQVTRGLSDLADQFEGIERIGEGLVECSMAIIRGPAVRPLAPTRVQVPNGKGGVMDVTLGVNSLIFTETEFGAEVQALAQMKPSDFLVRLSDQIRQKTSDCCRQQVWDRLLPQSNQRRTIDVSHRRTREPKPVI